MDNEKLISRVDELIQKGATVLGTEYEGFNKRKYVDLVHFYEFKSASQSFVLKLFGKAHPYYIGFSEKVVDAQPSTTKRGIGMLQAVRGEIEQGWLSTTKGLISANIFGSFLEMAEHLLEEEYKDPAAVLILSLIHI